ncbi:MAG: hypothetical protein U5K31_02585 [Balneolaceae bacterium]|nr:hypothetical protein [Balneolaceae bacterium]
MSRKWTKYLLVAMTVSSFGPYLIGGGGVRLEHLVIYAAGGLAGIVFLFRMHRFELNRDLFVFSTLLILPLLWITAVSYGLGGRAFGGGSVPVFENFFQAWAIVFVFMFLSRYQPLSPFFETVVKTFLVCLGANMVVTLAQVLLNPDLYGVLEYFRAAGGDPEQKTVAAKAIAMGRYIGIYNQPLEAGGNYSLGLLGWAWLENNQRNFKSVGRWVLLGMMVVGGLLSVSKVFIFGGTFLFPDLHVRLRRPEGAPAVYVFAAGVRGTRRLVCEQHPVERAQLPAAPLPGRAGRRKPAGAPDGRTFRGRPRLG